MSTDKKLNILMFNMSAYSDWQKGISNRNRHVLEQFLISEKVNKILAVDYLPHTFKRAVKIFFRDLLGRPWPGRTIWRSPFFKARRVSDKLAVCSTVLNKIAPSTFWRQLKKLLVKLEFDDYLIWSYYPLELGWLTELKGQLKVFDAVDNWAEHPAYKKFAEQLQKNYQLIDEQADVIFTVSSELANLFSHQEKVHWLPNGVDLKHYQADYAIVNRDIGNLPRPIIGYLGTIQDRLDQDLVAYLAKSNSEKSFVLAGPVWYPKIKARFRGQKNLYFLGRKTYEEAPMYLQQFDVAIIPHKADKFIKSTDPMKLYEYLACGKPVVSTQGVKQDNLDSLIAVTTDWQQFNQAINAALTGDNYEQQQARIAAVKDQSWLKRTERMLELIYQKI